MDRTREPARATRRDGSARSARGRVCATVVLLLAACLAPAAQAAPCGGDAPPWVTMEVEAARLQTSEPLEFVEVDREGCVTTRYGSMDVRAGTYRRKMSADEHSGLAQLIARTGVDRLDASGLRKRLDAADAVRVKSNSGGIAGFVIADGDIVRISIDTGTRKNVLLWTAPVEEATLRPDVAELQSLVEFLQAVKHAGADASKEKLAEERP